MFTTKKIERIDTFVCAVSLYVAETSKASIKAYEPPLPITFFGIVAYGFVAQPFSKQLYMSFVMVHVLFEANASLSCRLPLQ